MSATIELSPELLRARSPRIILLGPRGGANVGAVCRAIKNMGGGLLVTVDASFDAAQARRMAVHGRDVFAARVQARDLDEAVSGCSMVVGTTARRGAYRVGAVEIGAVARDLIETEAAGAAAARPFAFVFGPEDRGLSNDEITRCHRLAFIPTAEEYTSLNLSQAVLICLYEVLLARSALQAPEARPGRPPADAAATARMLDDLESSLIDIGFLAEDHPERVMASLRSLLCRSGLDERELSILHGLARQIRWFAGGGREVAAEKKSRGAKLR